MNEDALYPTPWKVRIAIWIKWRTGRLSFHRPMSWIWDWALKTVDRWNEERLERWKEGWETWTRWKSIWEAIDG